MRAHNRPRVCKFMLLSPTKDWMNSSGKAVLTAFFCTPKLPSGRLSLTYKVVWANVDASKAVCQAAHIQGCMGLVKGRNNLGFRVKEADFPRAWAVINPGTTAPEKKAGNLIYKAMGLPFGVTTGMMEKWLDSITTPFKALGPTGFLIRSEVHPPQGIHIFNGQAILLQYLPEKDNHRQPVLLGPKGVTMGNGDPCAPKDLHFANDSRLHFWQRLQ